jgi:hypothetical protein
MKGKFKAGAAETIVWDALMLVILGCVPTAHGATCLGATSSGPTF